MEKFPRANPTIIHRLGAAISRRRRDLKYRERHHQKMSSGLDRALGGAGEAQSTAISSTVASEYEEAYIDMTDSRSESGVTQTSIANSLFDPRGPITIPPPPKASADGEFFECPYCYIIITIRDRSDWARHIFRDILPYVCIFPDCHSSSRLYATRREWSRHIRSQHVSLVSATEPVTKCPLCNDDAQGMTEMGLQRHIGRHLEDLALFAVPRGNPEDLEEEEEEQAGRDSAVEASASSKDSTADEEDHEYQNLSMNAYDRADAEGNAPQREEVLDSQAPAQDAAAAQVANTVSKATVLDETNSETSSTQKSMGSWRWASIPAYRLRRGPLETYLRRKFGNYKFFTDVSSKAPVGRHVCSQRSRSTPIHGGSGYPES
jgi:uncharacterized C2H2 Zn-finger protein